MNIEIKHRFTGAVLFSVEAGSLKAAVEIAVGSGTDLSGADLRDTDLRGTDLRGADLRGVYLSGAYLSGADLRGAYLSGASLRGTDLISAGQDSRGYEFFGQMRDGTLWIKAGCRYLPIDEALTHWQSAHADRPSIRAECLAKVEHIRAIARVRGWIDAEEQAA